ncbi:VOC family protein [Gordonia bronchialis]|uniref:VOC family protein n=1 Tax=Gordonia bronchialis TaxID=2054 RepID=UPI00242F65DA|nr:VOC family protein [Gordonia bronchialis]
MAYHELGAAARIRRAGLVGHRPVRARSPEREKETVNPLAVTGVRVELSAPEAPLRAAYAALLSADARRLERPNAHIVAGPGPAHRVLLEVDDVNGAARLLGRRGLPVAGPTEAAPPGLTGTDVRTASSVPLGICAARRPSESFGSSDTDITGIDHLVFMCNDRDQAVALFGATLGLDFRLDRRIPDVGAPGPETPESGEPATDVHQMFFRGGEIIFEVVAGAPRPADAAPLELWGIAWHSPDLERTRTRLLDAGLSVTPIRAGRKPGTRIATVRNGPDLATRTVIIGPDV